MICAPNGVSDSLANLKNCFPNGQNDRLANLKHCFPYGIPMMVMHHIIPDKIQDKPLNSPPNSNHSMFPKVLTSFVPFIFDAYASLTNGKPGSFISDFKA